MAKQVSAYDYAVASTVEWWVDAGLEIFRAFNAMAIRQFAPGATPSAGLKPVFIRINANTRRLNCPARRDAA